MRALALGLRKKPKWAPRNACCKVPTPPRRARKGAASNAMHTLGEGASTAKEVALLLCLG